MPLATLAAVLFVVAYNMGEWREIGGIWRLDWADKSVWMITFALTVMADLTVAVEVGMALAALLYIHRVTDTTSIATVTPEYIEDGRAHVLQDKHVPSYVTILRIHGPFLFGMTDKLADVTADLSQFAPIVILRLRNMTAIDASGLHALETLSDRLKKSGRTLILCGARHQPARIPPPGRVHRSCRRSTTSCRTSRRPSRARRISIRASLSWARTPRAIWRRRHCREVRLSAIVCRSQVWRRVLHSAGFSWSGACQFRARCKM